MYSSLFRNGKIDPYPPAIRKILCVSKEEFKRLKVLIGTRRKRRSRSRGLTPWLKNKKRSLSKVIDKRQRETYEATNMAQAYESETWQWIRVKQWFNDYKDDYTLR